MERSWDVTQQAPPVYDGPPEEPPMRALLEWPAVAVMAGALGASAWLQWHLVTVALAVLVGTVAVCKAWSALAPRGLRAERRLSYARVFPDDPVELVVRLENRKALPLPWVEVSQVLPEGLLPPGEPLRRIARVGLLWHQAGTLRLSLTGRRRGYYRLRPAVLATGDPFGMYPRQQAFGHGASLIVYPRLLPLADLGLASVSLFGEMSRRRQLLQDPTNMVGTRDYAPGDPVRSVHWKATAKRRHLQVKVFAPSTDLHVVLLLAVDSFEGRPDDLELAISAAASMAFQVREQQSPVGLVTNARLATGALEADLPPRPGEDHLMRVLETLALVTGTATRPFEELLDARARGLPRDAALVCIHAGPSAAVRQRLRRLASEGQRVVLCTTGEGPRPWMGDGIEEHVLAHQPQRSGVVEPEGIPA